MAGKSARKNNRQDEYGLDTSGKARQYHTAESAQYIFRIPISATGGSTQTYTESGTSYKSHTFTTSGSFVVTAGKNSTIDFILVAGGGSGGDGNANGGGGGAGGVVVGTGIPVISGTTYPVVIGNGGTFQGTNAPGGQGGDSTFLTSQVGIITATGGGGGGGVPSPTPAMIGGSGGGGAGPASPGVGGTSIQISYAPNIVGYGNSGGSFYIPSANGNKGGGGGGAGAAGATGGNPYLVNPGVGGAGLENTFRDGTPQFYAGGGGGALYPQPPATPAPGGAGGGGGGAVYPPPGSAEPFTNATANTGGGGGGAADGDFPTVYKGGSGILVVRYLA